jgi:hypothetical protein
MTQRNQFVGEVHQLLGHPLLLLQGQGELLERQRGLMEL